MSIVSVHPPAVYRIYSSQSQKMLEDNRDEDADLDTSFESSDTTGQRYASELVKVELNNDDDADQEDVHDIHSSLHNLSPMEQIVSQFNLVPLGDVTIPHSPNTPLISMTIPMVHLLPITVVEGIAKYKMLLSKNYDHVAFHPTRSLSSTHERTHTEREHEQKYFNVENDTSIDIDGNKMECKDPLEDDSTALNLSNHHIKLENCSEEDAIIPGLSKVNNERLKQGNEEDHLPFIKVKQVESLKQVSESQVNNCEECNINFTKEENYIAHKKYYCSGMKQTQTNTDTRISKRLRVSKVNHSSSPSPSPVVSNIEVSKTMPRVSPLPPSSPQPITPFFACQGCGIKFKSINNLQVHQTSYCAGFKISEKTADEEEEKKKLIHIPRIPQILGMPGLSAMHMLSLLSAHKLSKEKGGVEESSYPNTVYKENVIEESHELVCVLCGLKETSVDQLKDHISIHFIEKMRKRSADDLEEKDTAKKIKKAWPMENDEQRMNHTQNNNKTDTNDKRMKCNKCGISFGNLSTYEAHVKHYCNNRE